MDGGKHGHPLTTSHLQCVMEGGGVYSIVIPGITSMQYVTTLYNYRRAHTVDCCYPRANQQWPIIYTCENIQHCHTPGLTSSGPVACIRIRTCIGSPPPLPHTHMFYVPVDVRVQPIVDQYVPLAVECRERCASPPVLNNDYSDL